MRRTGLPPLKGFDGKPATWHIIIIIKYQKNVIYNIEYKKNKMEATNPNVFTFLDYECKPLQ